MEAIGVSGSIFYDGKLLRIDHDVFRQVIRLPGMGKMQNVLLAANGRPAGKVEIQISEVALADFRSAKGSISFKHGFLGFQVQGQEEVSPSNGDEAQRFANYVTFMRKDEISFKKLYEAVSEGILK